MSEKIIKGNTFTKGNANAETLTVNSDKSTNGIAGSIATVKKDSDNDSTDVAVFFDVSKINTQDQSSAEVYALVSRVVNSVDFNGKGLVGANLVGRNTGNGNFEFINGGFFTASNQGGGNVDFLIGNNVKSSVTGSDTCTIDIMRADSGDVEIDNVNATVNNAQGAHPSVQMTNGTIGDVDCVYFDLDYDNTGNITVTGDIAYIRAGNDALPTVGGNIYFIKSDSPYPSEFAGSIKATSFSGDGANISNVNALTLDGESKLNFSKRIDLSGEVQTTAFRKSVIALCDLTNTNPSLNSFSSGNIVFHRRNGLSSTSIVKLYFNIEKRFNTEGYNFNYTIYGDKSLIEDVKFVRFNYNGVKYGGIDFFFNNSEHETVVFNGETNFNIFGLDYFNTQTSTPINSEVNSSIDDLEKFEYDGFLFNGNYIFNSSNVSEGTGISITETSTGNYEISLNQAIITNNVLNTNTTDLITTSTGVNDEVYSYTIPANTLQVGDTLNLKCYAINSGGATSGGVVFNFGGVGLNIGNGLTFSGGSSPVIDIDVEIIITSTTGFRYNSKFEITANNFASGNTYNGRVAQDYSAGSFDTTTDEDLTLTVNNPVNGDVVVKTISIKHFKS